MTRVAVLVIAALNQPVYHHYIRSYWTEMIRYTNAEMPDVDVFLLIENGTRRELFAGLGDNVIEDRLTNFEAVVPRRFHHPGVPSILTKTIHALDVLAGDYDVFFRTNLSSMLKIRSFERFVRARHDDGRTCYSGAWVWTDALRSDLVNLKRVGRDKSITDLAELDDYPGNTFVSGAGFFLNADEAAILVTRRYQLRYDLPDDVAVGLMLDHHEVLNDFAVIIRPETPLPDMMDRIRAMRGCHIRLQHFPVETADALWCELEREPLWQS